MREEHDGYGIVWFPGEFKPVIGEKTFEVLKPKILIYKNSEEIDSLSFVIEYPRIFGSNLNLDDIIDSAKDKVKKRIDEIIHGNKNIDTNQEFGLNLDNGQFEKIG